MAIAHKNREKHPVSAKKPHDGPKFAKSKNGPQRAFMNVHERMSADLSREVVRPRFPSMFDYLFQRGIRYKGAYGGRGAAKSHSFGGALVLLSAAEPLRILCAREFQVSIKDSVMELLKHKIGEYKQTQRFKYGRTYIEGKNGSEFVFAGLRTNPAEIKSLEGIDVCWVEEAQRVSEESWVYLIPTIRKDGSEIWVTFNPDAETDPTYQRFVVNPPENAVIRKVGWQDNPWFNETMNQERLYTLATDPDAYDWIWEGNCRKVSDAVVFRGKFAIEEFETPNDARFLFGADWGFGSDPTVLVRCYIVGRTLFVDRECYAFRLDMDRIAPTWREGVEECDRWPILADNSQPQTIAHVRSFGFNIQGADKWGGSIEDGINFMRSFERIVVHPRCYHTGEEMRLYSYKTDRLTGDVLPVILDKHNHCIDALRYALQRHIRCKSISVWEKLGAEL